MFNNAEQFARLQQGLMSMHSESVLRKTRVPPRRIKKLKHDLAEHYAMELITGYITRNEVIKSRNEKGMSVKEISLKYFTKALPITIGKREKAHKHYVKKTYSELKMGRKQRPEDFWSDT